MTTVAARAGGGRLAAWLVFVLALAALNYSSRLLAPEEVERRDLVYRWSTLAGGLVQFGLMLALVLWIAGPDARRELLALRRPRSWPRAAGLALAVVVATLVAAAALNPFLNAGEEQGLTPDGWDPTRATAFAANAVLIAGFVPVVEELAFRGLGLSLLLARFGPLLAVAANGVLFGLAHGLLLALPILSLFGAALAWLRLRTDSVLPAIFTHALFNGFALGASVVLGGG